MPFRLFLLLPRLHSVSGMPRCRPPPPWSTSRPRLWRALGPWSGSRASNSLSLTSPLRVPTTPLSPLRAWASCTRAQAEGATVGAREESGGVRLEPPGTEGQERVARGPTLAAGTTWWSRSVTEAWMSSPSCECFKVVVFFLKTKNIIGKGKVNEEKVCITLTFPLTRSSDSHAGTARSHLVWMPKVPLGIRSSSTQALYNICGQRESCLCVPDPGS